MSAKIITALSAAVLIIILALQNTAQVDFQFFAWEFSGSLSLFLIICIILGMLIGSLFTISLRKDIKNLRENTVESKPTSDDPLVKQ